MAVHLKDARAVLITFPDGTTERVECAEIRVTDAWVYAYEAPVYGERRLVRSWPVGAIRSWEYSL